MKESNQKEKEKIRNERNERTGKTELKKRKRKTRRRELPKPEFCMSSHYKGRREGSRHAALPS